MKVARILDDSDIARKIIGGVNILRYDYLRALFLF